MTGPGERSVLRAKIARYQAACVKSQQLDVREEGQFTAALVVVACGVAAFATLVIAAVTRACQ